MLATNWENTDWSVLTLHIVDDVCNVVLDFEVPYYSCPGYILDF